jgi:hypothetical protein
MTAIQDAMVALFGLGCLLLVFYGPWQWVMTDIARQIVFEQRDALFDLARSGRISFESEQYRKIRTSLNRLIQFAHNLTWPRFLLLMIKLHRAGYMARKSELTHAIEAVEDPELQKQLKDCVQKAQKAMIGTMGLKSIFISAPLFLVVVTLI